MLALLGYCIVSILVTLFLKPFLNLDKSVAAYAFPFGIVLIIFLSTASADVFMHAWHRYAGIGIGIICEVFFLITVLRRSKND